MIELHYGDCLEIMPLIPDKSIDMILCDLPYGTTACKWDTIIPFDKLWKEYERLIKPNGAIVLTASQPFASALIMSNPKLFRYEWIWDKVIPTGFTMANYRPMTNHENVLVFSKGKMTYTPNGGYIKFNPQKTKRDKPIKGYAVTSKFLHDVEFDKQERIYDEKCPMSIIQFKKDKTREHTSQKPVSLFEYLIKSYSDESDLILDNCMGSGTTGVACKNLNRKFIGIEKDYKYFEISKKRINYEQDSSTTND
jgi:site-specific DNA-methyltransferase (adenine-specific)